MSGHVFHPGHDELHGVTVVLRGASGRTYVGRWHERRPDGVLLRDAAIHEPTAGDVEAWLAKLSRFGVPPEHRTLLVPVDDAGSISRLGGM
jgi:hypothetical protein